MFAAMKNMIAFAVIFFVSLVESAPYSKYGRTCKDIGCPSNEVCIMAEDPCTYSNSQCGRYPTCKKMSSGEQTCRTFICPSGQYCKTDNGRPVCVNSSPGLETNWDESELTPWHIDNNIGSGILEENTISEYNDLRNGASADFYGHFAKEVYPVEPELLSRMRRDVPISEYPNSDSLRSGNSEGIKSEAKDEVKDTSSRNTGYPAGSGYPAQSGYPDSSLKRPSNSGYSSSGSGYPSSFGDSSEGSTSSGNSRNSPSRSGSGYPDSSRKSTPGSNTRTSSGYPAGSGYPSESGYPDDTLKKSSVSSLNSDNSRTTSSGYSGGSGYPSGSGYPAGPGYSSGRGSGYPPSYGYPPNSGYPSGSDYASRRGYPGGAGYPDEAMRKTSASSVNAGNPGSLSSGYPNSGYPNVGYPNSGYPAQTPNQYGGYQDQYGRYPNQYGNYPYQAGGYSQSKYQGSYAQQGYPSGYPQEGYPGNFPTAPKPSIGDQLQQFARNLAKKIVTQAIIDKVAGRT